MSKKRQDFKFFLKGIIFVLVLVWAYSGASLPGLFTFKIDSAHAAITFTNLGASSDPPDITDGTDATSYSNSSWTPPTEGLIMIFIQNGNATSTMDVASVTGNGLTWVEIASKTWGGGTPRLLTIYAADATGATAGVTTIDYGANTQVHILASFVHATGVDLSGGVLAAFVQTPSNSGNAALGTVTLAAAADSNNRPIVAISHTANEATNAWTSQNWTEADDITGTAGVRGMNTQYSADSFQTTGSASWATSAQWGGIAAELKADTGAAASTFTQSAFRFFENANSNQIGAPLANSNASASINTHTGEFRMRMTLDVATANLAESGQSFKLQAAQKTSTCSGATYADVTTTSSISFNDNLNPTASSGVSLYSNDLDPQGTGIQRDQTYKEANNFTNTIQSIAVGENGLWDFSLKDFDADDASSYCFRIVKSDGSTITYSKYAEIKTFDVVASARRIIEHGGGGGVGTDSGASGGGTPVGGGGPGGGGQTEGGGGGGGNPQGGGGGGGGDASPILFILFGIFQT